MESDWSGDKEGVAGPVQEMENLELSREDVP